MWPNNLFDLMQTFIANSIAFLLFYFTPISCFRFFSPLLFYFWSSILFLSYFLPALLFYLLSILLSCFIFTLVSLSSAIFSLFFKFNLIVFYLIFSNLKTIKQTLLDKFLQRYLTSLIKFLYFILLFGLLPNQINCKQIFNIAFINFCLFTGNYILKNVDLSFE